MIELNELVVSNGQFQLTGICLSVEAGRYAVLRGATGAGKTTLLEAICGLKPVTSGTVVLNRKDVTHLSPGQRAVGLVPQDGVLFSHLSVVQHLEFALRVRRWSSADAEARVAQLVELLNLGGLEARRPHQLSRGEQQRVALGRAISFRPSILCLDEPLSALDDRSRQQMIDLLKSLPDATQATVLHITHNADDCRQLAQVDFQLIDGQIKKGDRRIY
jgi:ABC-type sulfate/molybdate transport systems ATPase subunit